MSCKNYESMYRIKEKRIVIYGYKHMDSFLDDEEFGNAFWVCYCTPSRADHRFRRCVLSKIQFMLDNHCCRVWQVLYIQPYTHGCTFVWYICTHGLIKTSLNVWKFCIIIHTNHRKEFKDMAPCSNAQ